MHRVNVSTKSTDAAASVSTAQMNGTPAAAEPTSEEAKQNFTGAMLEPSPANKYWVSICRFVICFKSRLCYKAALGALQGCSRYLSCAKEHESKQGTAFSPEAAACMCNSTRC